MEVGLKVSGGEFTELDLGAVTLETLDIDATSSRFKVGLVWWPWHPPDNSAPGATPR